jgi:hypothetical protein
MQKGQDRLSKHNIEINEIDKKKTEIIDLTNGKIL